jgi:hypothetical protein
LHLQEEGLPDAGFVEILSFFGLLQGGGTVFDTFGFLALTDWH